MNKVQINHLNNLLEQARDIMTAKYVAGAKEHQSVLSEDYTVEQLLMEVVNEQIDGLTYSLTALNKLRSERNGK